MRVCDMDLSGVTAVDPRIQADLDRLAHRAEVRGVKLFVEEVARVRAAISTLGHEVVQSRLTVDEQDRALIEARRLAEELQAKCDGMAVEAEKALLELSLQVEGLEEQHNDLERRYLELHHSNLALTEENARLEADLDMMIRCIPAWVRRLCGVSL